MDEKIEKQIERYMKLIKSSRAFSNTAADLEQWAEEFVPEESRHLFKSIIQSQTEVFGEFSGNVQGAYLKELKETFEALPEEERPGIDEIFDMLRNLC